MIQIIQLLVLSCLLLSIAAQADVREDFSKAQQTFEQQQKENLAKAHIENLQHRTNTAIARAGLHPNEFDFMTIDQEVYLRSKDQICKLIYGHRTVRGLECGVLNGALEIFGASEARCQVDDYASDRLDCYQTLPAR